MIPERITIRPGTQCRDVESGEVLPFPTVVTVNAIRLAGIAAFRFTHEGRHWSVPAQLVQVFSTDIKVEYRFDDGAWLVRSCKSPAHAAGVAKKLRDQGAELRIIKPEAPA